MQTDISHQQDHLIIRIPDDLAATINWPEGTALEALLFEGQLIISPTHSSPTASSQVPDNDIQQDPLFQIKSHDSEAPKDLSINADYYLYQANPE